ACVQDDEGHGDPSGVVDGIRGGAALDDFHASKEVQQVHQVVGQEAEQRDTQDGVNDPHALNTADKCYICLSHFEQQTVASLQNCQHVFCLECILQWSQTANTCPVDRISFAFIHQRQCPGGAIQKKKKDANDEEEASDAVICEECGRSDRRHRLLVCIHCDSGYHMDCLTPSLNTGPEGDWICPECAASPHHTGKAVSLYIFC
uniref:PHD and ring finger domains 1 n=1 Tax=Seriola dumerili TaxID=41447 RepID=A0A3B4TH32_SERDU